MRYQSGAKWMVWLWVMSALTLGCGRSLSQVGQAEALEPRMRRRWAAPGACEMALSREVDDSPPKIGTP